MEDALILAKSKDFDVFNALDLMENAPDVLMDLRFGIGDGNLRYYLYNWRVAEVVLPSQIGLVLT
jgi:glycylpeptide N-tetradecanoyltransferase